MRCALLLASGLDMSLKLAPRRSETGHVTVTTGTYFACKCGPSAVSIRDGRAKIPPFARGLGAKGEKQGLGALATEASALDRAEVRAVFRDHALVPVGGIFEDALLARVVAKNQAEAVLVTVRPLEVVDERPVKISVDRHAVGDGATQLEQVTLREIDPLGVVHSTVERRPVTRREAIFRDHDRLFVALPKQA